jgi:hypothetical protein
MQPGPSMVVYEVHITAAAAEITKTAAVVEEGELEMASEIIVTVCPMATPTGLKRCKVLMKYSSRC